MSPEMGYAQERFEVAWDDFATSNETSGYRIGFVLPEGAVWRIDNFYVLAQTQYVAVDSNYQTFTLYDTDGNGICSVANGPAATGLAINAYGSGKTSTMTSAYEFVDATDGDAYVYVGTAATSSGLSMVGIKCILIATPVRKGMATLST